MDPSKDDVPILLARIDERTRQLQDSVKELGKNVEKNYVTQQEFTPVKRAFYGTMTAFVLWILSQTLSTVFMK